MKYVPEAPAKQFRTTTVSLYNDKERAAWERYCAKINREIKNSGSAPLGKCEILKVILLEHLKSAGCHVTPSITIKGRKS